MNTKEATAAWPKVTQEDVPPAAKSIGKENQCFWCDAPIGKPHNFECVCVTRKVRLRYIFEVDVNVPYSWPEDQIVVHRTELTWCADNAIRELEEQKKSDGCLCNRFNCEFAGEVDNTPNLGH
jgi:hypothetical protein